MGLAHIITVGFHAGHILKPVAKYGASKIILIYSFKEDVKEQVEEALEKAKMIAEELGIPHEVIEIKDPYNFKDNVKIVKEIIKSEKRTIVNVTGGRKITSFAVLYAAMQMYRYVEKIIYVSEEGVIIELPKIITQTPHLTSFEMKIVNLLMDKEKATITEISKKLGVAKATVSSYVKKLAEKGVVNVEVIGRNKIVRLAESI